MRVCPRRLCLAVSLLLTVPLSGRAGPLEILPRKETPVESLQVDAAWRLQPPDAGRFDASALLRLPDGTLLTVNDKRAGLWRIELPARGDVAKVVSVPDVFTPEALTAAAGAKAKLYDLEGLAADAAGRLYVCDESSRNVFRYDPADRTTRRLPIDWTPARRWFSRDGNASWEGIAVGGDQLYLANERDTGRIFVVGLTNLVVEDSFSVSPPGRPARDVHYSDLCWWGDRLWVLCRESHCVLEVDPVTRKVVSSLDYSGIERDLRYAYFNPLPYGFVEGLAIDATHVWLVVDNNGTPRLADRSDVRPSLWRCLRPPPKASR